jgi:hypothetical protein
MEYTTKRLHFAVCSGRAALVANGIGAKLARFARRLTAGLAQLGQRDVDREIARVRASGRITDGTEREIMRKVLTSDWRVRQ